MATLFESETNDVHEENDQQILQAQASSQPIQQEEVSVPMQLPTSLSQEEREDLTQRNAGRHDWIEEVGAQDRSVTGRGSQRIADLQVSTTDPDPLLCCTRMDRIWAIRPTMSWMEANHVSF